MVIIKVCINIGLLLALSFSTIYCSKVPTRIDDNSSAASNTPPTNTTPGAVQPLGPQAATFSAGDTFTPTVTPYTLNGPIVGQIMLYSQVQGFKAIAVAENGQGYAGGDPAFTSQAEADEVILERCQLSSGNQPCALFASGDTLVYSDTDFYDQHQDVLESGARNFNASTIPGLAFEWRQLAAGDGYDTRNETFKAYAISPNGTTSPGWSNVSQAEASRLALEFCESNDSTDSVACTLYAEGDTVLFNVNQFSLNTTRALQFAPSALDPNNVPFVSDDLRAGSIANLAARIANGDNIVITISPFGHFDSESGPAINNTLIQASLNDCNGRIPAGASYQCLVYSTNDEVVMTRATLTTALGQ